MKQLGLARRYARALFASSSAALTLDGDAAALTALAEGFEAGGELRALLLNPALAGGRDAAVAHLSAQAGGSPAAAALVGLLVEKRRARLLPAVAEALRELVDAHHGRRRAIVHTAVELNADRRAALVAALAKRVGAAVEAEFHVDPALIGGVVVRIGGELYDDSLARHLSDLRSRLVAA